MKQVTLFENYSTNSPLVYPGGKRKSIKRFLSFLPTTTKVVCSPFVGGASIELCCAANGIQVVASDNFEPLINFWKQFQANSAAVIDLAISLFPLPFEKQKEFFTQGLKPCLDISDLERAACFFLMNRQSFRGLTLALGPQRQWDHGSCNVELFKKFRDWSNPNITFSHNDYSEAIDKHEGTFMYFDPPYIDNAHVYGCRSDRQPGVDIFDHYKFHEKITSLSCKWVLSYKKHDIITDLYKDYNITEYSHNHNLTSTKGSSPVIELFIKNF